MVYGQRARWEQLHQRPRSLRIVAVTDPLLDRDALNEVLRVVAEEAQPRTARPGRPDHGSFTS